MAKLPVVFKYGSRADYEGLEQKSSEALYFLTDTGEIYRGDVNLARGSHYEIECNGDETAEQAFALIQAQYAEAHENEHLYAVKDDILVVKRLIAGDKYSYTSYVFDGEHWGAMDGNYNANNVFFDEDIMITTAVGNVTLSNGSANIPAAGKNIRQVFEALWTKENYNPTVDTPSISLSLNKTSAKGEVGTSFDAPVATASVSDFGSFQFGSKDAEGKFYSASTATDIVFSSLKVGAATTAAGLTSNNSAEITNIDANATTKSVTYTGSNGTFSDSAQTQKFSAIATYGASARKGVSNLGNFVNAAGTEAVENYASAGKGIAANTGTGDMKKDGSASFTATGYRAWFFGMLDYVPAAEDIDSAFIRDLTNKGEVSTKTHTVKPGEAGMKTVLVAIPASAGSLTKAILTSSMNTDITEDYTKNKITVKVADASEAEGTEVDYNVYWYKPAELGSDEVHDLTVTKK